MADQRPHQYTYDPDGFIQKIKRYHKDNYDSVSAALLHANKQLRKSIASSSESELTNTRLYSMLLSVWCEARLHTLLYEDGAFDEAQRSIVYNIDSVENRWKKALYVAIVKKSGLTIGDDISDINTDFSLKNIFDKINQLIAEHFSSAIRNRNKIAHAQWITPFTNLQGVWENSSSFSVCEKTKIDYKEENLLVLDLKVKLIKSIAVAINNIAVNSEAGGYQVQSFDALYRDIRTHEEALKSVDFIAFKSSIRQSYQAHQTQ